MRKSPELRLIKDALGRPVIEGGPSLFTVLEALKEDGARPIIVGGWVRDLLLGRQSTDIDIEVFDTDPPRLEAVLGRYLPLVLVGRVFAVYKVRGVDIEFSLPRQDSLTGPSHRDFAVKVIPGLSFRDAARRRDFTINAMGMDPFSCEILDPWNGRGHLEEKLLDVVDADRFGDDPLRVMRAAQFLSRFEFRPSKLLITCGRQMDAETLSRERVFGEFSKMLLGVRPSLGLRYLLQAGWVRIFPEVAALVALPQDPTWHPEGDVWDHTLKCLDEAVRLRTGDAQRDLMLMFGVLCHDFGKADTTRVLDGRIRSLGHGEAGVIRARGFLTRLTADRVLIAGVEKLVREHLTPDFLYAHNARLPAVRRLARRLAPEVDIELLERCSRADYRGSRLKGDDEFAAGTWLLDAAQRAGVRDQPEAPVLRGRHLLEMGLRPGPRLGVLLTRAYEIQTEEGIKEVSVLRDRVLAEGETIGDGMPSVSPARGNGEVGQ